MNSRSRKPRGFRPRSTAYMPESLHVDRRRRLAQMHSFLQKRVSRARDPNRRLGGALTAQRAVSDCSWMGLAPCKKRRMLEVTLRQQGPLEHIPGASTRGAQKPAHFVPRAWCLDLGSSRWPFHTYRLPPGPFAPRLGRRSRRSSRRRSRSGPRKFEKLYVDGADGLGRWSRG